MQVPVGNRVEVKVSTRSAFTADGRLSYIYTIHHLPTSHQGLADIHIPCPSVSSPTQLEGGDWRIWSGWDTGTYCEYYGNLAAIGDSGRVRFSTVLLPDTGTIILRGGTSGYSWPTSDPTSATAALKPLVDSLAGESENGLVKRIVGVVPSHPIPLVANAATGLPILIGALRHVCEDTDWIQPGPTCDALTAQIATASSALGTSPVQRANPPQAAKDATRQALTALIQSLSAGRGTTINENAFSILNLLARTVRSGIGQ